MKRPCPDCGTENEPIAVQTGWVTCRCSGCETPYSRRTVMQDVIEEAANKVQAVRRKRARWLEEGK